MISLELENAKRFALKDKTVLSVLEEFDCTIDDISIISESRGKQLQVGLVDFPELITGAGGKPTRIIRTVSIDLAAKEAKCAKQTKS